MFLNLLPNLILIGFFSLYFWELKDIMNYEVTSSAFLPMLSVLVMYILNIIQIIRKLINKSEQIKTLFTKDDLYLLIVLFLVITYIWVLSRFGFIISSSFFIFLLTVFWRSRRKPIDVGLLISSIIVSIGFPVSIFYFFGQIVKINLP